MKVVDEKDKTGRKIDNLYDRAIDSNKKRKEDVLQKATDKTDGTKPTQVKKKETTNNTKPQNKAELPKAAKSDHPKKQGGDSNILDKLNSQSNEEVKENRDSGKKA